MFINHNAETMNNIVGIAGTTATIGIQYRHLSGDNSIRLLRFDEALWMDSGMLNLTFEVRELLPDVTTALDRTKKDGICGDDAACTGRTLDNRDVTGDAGDHTKEYYAISYTWGQSQALVPIMLDGHQVHIRESAARALEGIASLINESSQCNNALVWIDAVCINQADLDEKQIQVALMGMVYSQAKMVFGWLGSDNDTSALITLEMIQLLAKQHDEFHEARLQERDWSREPLPLGVEMTPIRSFFSNPWFTRLWVLQEVVLNREIVLIRGKVLITWPVFAKAVKRLSKAKLPIPELLGPVAMDSLKRGETWPTLNRLLLLSVMYGATNPRDKVYAVLGLVEKIVNLADAKAIVPDYQKPLMEIYRDATALALRDQAELMLVLIGQVFGPLPEEMLGYWPSWVPRYHGADARPIQAHTLGPQVRGNASLSLLSKCAVDDVGTMFACGVRVQSIKEVRLRGLTSQGELEVFLRELWNMDREWRSSDLVSLAASLTNGEYRGQYAEDCDDLPRDLGRYMLDIRDMTSPCNASLEQILLEASVERGTAAHFLAGFRERGYSHHALIELEDGSFARSFDVARVGEHACIIFGMQEPILLRSTGELRNSIDCFKMRGTVYVPGIGEGEHIQRLKDKGQLEIKTIFAIT